MARPDLFKIEPLTRLSLPDPLVGFGLALSDGTNGFPRGLLVSTGPQTVTDRVLFVDPSGNASVFKTGFVSNEGLAFATGFTPAGSGQGPAQLTYGPGGVLYATDLSAGLSDV